MGYGARPGGSSRRPTPTQRLPIELRRGGGPDALLPLRLRAAARVSPTASIFHVAAQEGRDGLGQLIFAFPGVSPFFSGEKHQTQHIALAEDGGGGSGMGVQERFLGDGGC